MSKTHKSSFGIAKSDCSFTVSVYMERMMGNGTWLKVNLGSKTFPRGPVDVTAEWRG